MPQQRIVSTGSDLFNEKKQIRKENREHFKKNKINWGAVKTFDLLKELPSFRCAEK